MLCLSSFLFRVLVGQVLVLVLVGQVLVVILAGLVLVLVALILILVLVLVGPVLVNITGPNTCPQPQINRLINVPGGCLTNYQSDVISTHRHLEYAIDRPDSTALTHVL